MMHDNENISSVSTLRRLLADHGIAPRKRWGQNFLIDRRILDALMTSISPQAGEKILEIGPGAGVLTRALAAAGSQVLALDIDARFASLLPEVLGEYADRVTFQRGDALDFDFLSFSPDKVVGNLPYYITSPLLFRLLKSRQIPRRMVFMVQLEVAERICAHPGSKAYGVLSVVCAYRTECRILLKAPPSSFWPQPDVHSAAVELESATGDWLPSSLEPFFFSLVESAFSQRRKTLVNSLGGLGIERSQLRQALVAACVEPTSRAEQLSVDEFRRLTCILYENDARWL